MARLVVVIDNITEGQAKAFEHLFAGLTYLGRVGCSRHITLVCDGDGNFRPHILIQDKDDATAIREPEFDNTREFDVSKPIRIGMNW